MKSIKGKNKNILAIFTLVLLLLYVFSMVYIPRIAKAEEENYIKSASVLLGESIAVKYDLQIPQGYTQLKMDYNFKGNNSSQIYDISECDGIYSVNFENLSPLDMDKNLSATATLTGTEKTDIVCKKDNFNIKSYCKELLSKSATDYSYTQAQYNAMSTLVVDLLSYGDATKSYVNEAGDSFLSELTDSQKQNKSEFVAKTTSDKEVIGTAEGFKWKEAGLNLNSKIDMYISFESDIQLTTPTLEITNGESIDKIENLNESTSVVDGETTYIYKGIYDKISVLDVNNVLSIKAFNNGVAFGKTLKYSVNSYIFAKQNEKESEQLTTMAELSRAVSNYCSSAIAYKEAFNQTTDSIEIKMEVDDARVVYSGVKFPIQDNSKATVFQESIKDGFDTKSEGKHSEGFTEVGNKITIKYTSQKTGKIDLKIRAQSVSGKGADDQNMGEVCGIVFNNGEQFKAIGKVGHASSSSGNWLNLDLWYDVTIAENLDLVVGENTIVLNIIKYATLIRFPNIDTFIFNIH